MGTPGLQSSAEFQRVLRRGRKGGANGVVVYAAPCRAAAAGEGSKAPTRIGLVVRAPQRAVTRNRIKRRLRAAFVACDPPVGYDVVIRADERAEAMDFTELTEAVSTALDACCIPGDRRARR